MAVQPNLFRLAHLIEGDLIQPDSPAFDSARRLWNGMFDKRPAAIATCRNPGDVAAAVDFAQDEHSVVSVRGGGHGVAGLALADAGLVIDLSGMRNVEVDPDRRTVRAEGGATIGDIDAATGVHGLVTPLGVVSRTGIAGLTLGGGMGWLRRKYGLSCDNLIAAELVTADGTKLNVSEAENAELLWGLRGGGGNFGVVTSFEYRLHEVGPKVMFCLIFYPGAMAKELLQFTDQYTAEAPDDVSPIAFLGTVAEGAEYFPVQSHGQAFAAVGAMWAGSVEEGDEALLPLRSLGEPIADFSGPMDYAEAQKLLDAEYPDGLRYYWKATNSGALDEKVVDKLVEFAAEAPSSRSTVDVWYNGGAMSRVGPEESAFGRRYAYLLTPESNWADPAHDEVNIQWTRESLHELEMFSDNGTYLNFAGFLEEGQELMQKSYGRANYERLRALKDKYDPYNFFRLNQNVLPHAG